MRLTLIVAACIAATPVFSSEALCTKKSEFAAAAMTARQAGIPLSKLLSVIGEDDMSAETEAEMKGFAVEAYKENAWRTEELQERAITEFSNKVMLDCLSS